MTEILIVLNIQVCQFAVVEQILCKYQSNPMPWCKPVTNSKLHDDVKGCNLEYIFEYSQTETCFLKVV